MRFLLLLFATINFSTFAISQNISFEEGKVLLELTNESLSRNHPSIPLDYNSDGITDLIRMNTSGSCAVDIHKGLGNNQFELIDASNLSCNNPLKSIDFDNDGDIDIVMRRYICINESNDQFSVFNPMVSGTIVEVADFDNDSHMDIVVHANEDNFLDEELFIYYNNGDGTFDQNSLHSSGVYSDLDLGDMDNDGDIDIVVLDELEDFPVLILTNENGNFTPRYTQHAFLLTNSNLYLFDMDHDDDLDIILNDPFTGMYLIENNENLYDDDQNHFFFTNQISYFNIADLNNDDIMDIIYFGGNDFDFENIYALIGKGGFDFYPTYLIAQFDRSEFSTIPNTNYLANNLSLYDYDLDGKVDIIYTQGENDPNQVILYRNNTVLSNVEDTQYQDLRIVVAPNPTSGELKLIYGDNTSIKSEVNYELYSTMGVLESDGIIRENRLDLNHLPTGMYFIRLQNYGSCITIFKD